jgi:hypothetical protein
MPEKSKPDLQFDDFVQAARPDAANKNPLLFLQGYIGKSPSADSIRMYTDPSLNHFVDIPSKDIVHSRKVTDDPLGLGGSMIWVNIPTSKNKAATAYLEGNLYDDYIKKLYEKEKANPGTGTVVAATDFTKWTETLATDFTKVQMTDITKVLMTDITRIRDKILGRYTRVGTRGCPPWDFKDGSFLPGNAGGYYY